MQVRVLGGLEVLVDGTPVDLGGPKPRALIGLLVAAEARPVTVDQLVDEIWADDPPPRAEASLQSYVARLRRELEPQRQVRAQAARLRTHPGAYSLELDEDDVDARRFVALVRRARSGDPGADAEPLLTDALELWRGEPYAGAAAAPSLAAEATRLTELRWTALEDLWSLRVDRGEHGAAVGELERLVRQQPLRERLWALLALAQYRAARQGDALDTLRRARRHLAEELGIDPGEELRRLEQAVLGQDPGLSLARPAPRADHPPIDQAPEGTPAPGAPPLVGREAALTLAATAHDEAVAGRGRTVLVSGEAGIGKTRFTEAVLAEAQRRGFRTGRGTWDPDGSPPLWAWHRAVGEALEQEGLLAPVGNGVRDAASESFRLAEELVSALRDGPPTLLVLDDVHWADPDSLRLARRVAAQLAGVPAVLVLAVRTAAGETGGAVAEALGALARLDPLRVELGGLDAGAVTAYVHGQAGVEVTPDVADELTQRTGGNPFFVTEVVRLLASEGALAAPGSAAWQAVPLGVRDVVRQRLAQVPGADHVLAVAAVAGRSFDLDVLVQAGARPAADIDRAVESALLLGLVAEEAPGRCRFSHALVRDAVYESLPAPARARAHASVATALEARYAGRLAEHAAELAEHYRLAGPAHARSAWTFAAKAAAAAEERSAHDEARRLLALADELQQLDPAVDDTEREDVLVGLGRALRRLSRPLDAWPPLAAAGRSALRRGDAARAARALLEVAVDAVWGWRMRPEVDEDAIALWRSVIEALGDAQPLLRARAEVALAVEVLYQPSSSATASALVDTALTRARRAGVTPGELARLLNVAGLALARPELLHRRGTLTEEMVTLATRTGDERSLVVALAGRGALRGEAGRLDEARSDFQRAVDLARRHHLGQALAIAGWGLAVHDLAHGAYAEVERRVAEIQRLTESLAIPGAGIDVFLVATVRLLQGRLAELEQPLSYAAAYHPHAARDMHALAVLHAGRVDEVRALLGPWSEQPPLIEDYLWVTLTVLRAWLWLELGDSQAVADLRRQLAPYAGQLAAGSMSSSFLGSVDHTLGLLARADGDPVAARTHLEAALATYDARGLGMWADRARHDLVTVTGPAPG